MKKYLFEIYPKGEDGTPEYVEVNAHSSDDAHDKLMQSYPQAYVLNRFVQDWDVTQ